jgi:hypothetical protein
MEIRFLYYLHEDIVIEVNLPIVVDTDNTGAIAFLTAKDPLFRINNDL